MNRTLLFHASMATYGLVLGVDTALTVGESGLTVARGAILAASVFVLGGGAYGIARPGETSDLSDSWLAYVAAAGVLLVTASVVASRL